MIALYWRRTTGTGLAAGIVVPQVAYLAFSFLPETPVGSIVLFSSSYLGWGISIYCMVLGLVTTVAVSAVTAQAPDADTGLYFEGLRAD